MRERFTLVLKGHLALARVRFPAGTTGSALDALARGRCGPPGSTTTTAPATASAATSACTRAAAHLQAAQHRRAAAPA